MRFSTLSAGVTIISTAFAAPVAPVAVPGVNITAVTGDASAIIPDSFIIQYKDEATSADIASHRAQIKARLSKDPDGTYTLPNFNAIHLKTDAAGLGKVGSHPAILHVERDMRVQLTPLTNNTSILPSSKGGPIADYLVQNPSSTWGLGRISHYYRGYFNYIFDTSACSGTVAYVLDTGIRTSHVEFGGRASWGANFIAGSPNTDQHGHGTHVTGTIIGSSVGVCHLGKAIAVKVLDSTGAGSWTGLMAGMQWAYSNAVAKGTLHKSVQSISIGGGYTATVNNFVNAVVAAGMPVVVAAGNNGANTALYSPSSAVSAITVGAIDFYNNKASFSNYGAGVDIFGPGVTILSSYFTCDTCYYYMDGTSMATPHLSGLSLYFIAKEGLASPAAVLNRLVSASVKNYVVNAVGSPNRIAYNADGY